MSLVLQPNNTRRIYLAIIPAIYFALLGVFDIGLDIWHHTVGMQTVLNIVFFAPLIFRNRWVYVIFGSLLSLLWLYLAFASLAMMPGNTKITALQAILVEVWILFSLLCSLAIFYTGCKKPD